MTGPASTTERTRRRSFASSGLSYERVARELSLRLCDGSGDPLSHDDDRSHRRGYVTWDDGDRTIHWHPASRMTRRGLYRFLKLAAELLFPEDKREERWYALFLRDHHTRWLGARFGVRFPREYADRDRARARLDLEKVRLDYSYTEFHEQRTIIRRVTTWSRR